MLILKASEAARMVFIGDKYDIPKIFRLSEPTLCAHDDQMHFIKTSSGVQDPSTVELLDVVPLLSVANRVGLKRLRTHCQYVVLRDTISGIPTGKNPNSSDLMRSLRSLEISGVNPRDMHELAACLLYAFSEGLPLLKKKECSGCNRGGTEANIRGYCCICRGYTSWRETQPSPDETKTAFFTALSKIKEGDKKA